MRLPWVLHHVLYSPRLKPLKVSALPLRAKIRLRAQRCRRVEDSEKRRRVPLAHDIYPQRLDAVVDMHAGADIAIEHAVRRFNDVFVAEVPVPPGVLPEYILPGGHPC